jgi:hypothetical protein
MTIIAWIYPTVAANQNLLNKSDENMPPSAGQEVFHFGLKSNGKPYLSILLDDVDSNTAISTNAWTSIAATIDANDASIESDIVWYIKGTNAGSTNKPNLYFTDVDFSVGRIGAVWNTLLHQFNS